jgi:hypothetical protein
MSSYDPQRNRPRQRPRDDEPAAVDALLGSGDRTDAVADDRTDAVAEAPSDAVEDDNPKTAPDPLSTADRLAVPATAAPPAAPPELHDHEHGPDCDHGPDPAMGAAVALVSAFGVLFLLWRWLHRRRGSTE